jgi:hypothetical protein
LPTHDAGRLAMVISPIKRGIGGPRKQRNNGVGGKSQRQHTTTQEKLDGYGFHHLK